MIGIWCVSLWQDLGRPKHIRLVELGPGRGTLMADLLRATSPFTNFMSAVQIHLVEVRCGKQPAFSLGPEVHEN
jgi:NADH dehydrogenase [ubiquinone] 1 alpha subcomplex assembly factor 7